MHTNYNEELRKRVRTIMAENDINQVEVCRKTGIDKGDFSKFIRGKRNLGSVNYSKLSTFADAYKIEEAPVEEEKIEYLHIVEEEQPRDTYDDLSLDEIDDLTHRLTEIKRKKIQEKLSEIENEILKLYDLQEKYEKLLKEL